MSIESKTKTTAIIKFEDGHLKVKTNNSDQPSLSDIWSQAGKPGGKRPQDWLGTKEVVEFVLHIKNLKGDDHHLLDVRRGRGGGTYADLQIALKYAQYLSPEFQKTVNDVFIERVQEEANPELAIARGVKRLDKIMGDQGRGRESVEKRIKTIAKRHQLTDALAKHGVTGHKNPKLNGFVRATNATYVGWKGKTASELKTELGCEGKNLRDHLSDFDLDTLSFIEALGEQKIKAENTWGNDEAASVMHGVGKEVGNLVKSLNVVSPAQTKPLKLTEAA